MNPLGYFFGLLSRAPLPTDTVLLIAGNRWRIEQDGDVLATGPLTPSGALVIDVGDFCRVLGLKRRGA